MESFKLLKRKVTLVARGFTQKEGVDFNEIFSPIVKHSTIIILLAMVALLDSKLEQMDVKIIFFHGKLEEHILMVGKKVLGTSERKIAYLSQTISKAMVYKI